MLKEEELRRGDGRREDEDPLFVVSLVLISSPPTGSGSLAAMAVFEDRYKPDMEVTHC